MPYSVLLYGFSFSEVDTKKTACAGKCQNDIPILHMQSSSYRGKPHRRVRTVSLWFLQQRCELFQLSLLHTDGFQIGKTACLIEQ